MTITSPSITFFSVVVGTKAVISCSLVGSVNVASSSGPVFRIPGSLSDRKERYGYRSSETDYNLGTNDVPLLNRTHTEGFDPSSTLTCISGFPSPLISGKETVAGTRSAPWLLSRTMKYK